MYNVAKNMLFGSKHKRHQFLNNHVSQQIFNSITLSNAEKAFILYKIQY